jgi:lipopolysaccharide/colanic/teichoic acid biosynthesis glycosyltransferase
MTSQMFPVQVQTVMINSNYQRIKRLMDIALTLLMLPFLSIVCIIIAILVKLTSKGSVLFHQERVGRNGVMFDMYKFRSMYVNSDTSIHIEAVKQYMNGHKLQQNSSAHLSYKLGADARVTRIGRFLRKSSLDELPQFWNVLRGNMSLVGPRPPLPYEVELYSAHDCLRLAGKPGLTGVWQVYGRSRVTFQEIIEMDIAYLHRQSIREDLKLIALTVPVMLLGRGGA